MRETEYRGKRIDTGEWIYGGICQFEQYGTEIIYITIKPVNTPSKHTIDALFPAFVEVRPETVGQYAGFKDKNGVKIFEGDVVRFMEDMLDSQDIRDGEVVFKNGCFMADFPVTLEYLDDYDYVVIGNIHDNPELLEAEAAGTALRGRA
jgi:uncharacterized phage protein (TIGR01671 family)